jgi:CRISPR-associated endonuclease Csn1
MHLGPQDEIRFMQGKAAGIAVRGGYAEIGDSVHHARIYRIEGKRSAYSMVRVFTCDLLRHRGEDLFAVKLPPQSISMRSAEPKIREALVNGSAVSIGWLVVGDEMLLTMNEFAKGSTAVAKFLEVYPETTRWVLDGFYSESQLRLRPRYFAAEGLTDDARDQVRKVVEIPGWRPAVNALFVNAAPRIIRRDALGRPRLKSAAHLPVSWQVPGG